MKSNKQCLIVGYGVVGANLKAELKGLNIDVYDKYKTSVNTKKDQHYDFGFICVDTPFDSKSGNVDTSTVEEAIKENDCEIYVIKSTCTVGFAEELKRKTDKRIVFSPEFYGGTQHCNNFDFDFTVIGGDIEDCREVQQLFQHVYDARHKFFLTDLTTAEMVKFMENAWLATKVTFCADFYRACKKAGINYEQVREIWVSDTRVNPAHTFIYDESPFFDSHCLNKDVPSIANQFDMDMIKAVVQINDKYKNNSNFKDWLK